MSIEAITWEEAYPALPQMGYAHAGRVKQDVEQVRRAFPDLEPYVAQLPSGEVLFLMKGTLLKAQPNCPQVNFVVTLQQPFPNSYPILTIEEPEAPWRFANHPNVDTSGQTYLGAVSNWNPQRSTIFQCVDELKACLSRRLPFENTTNPQVAARPPPPPAQPLPPPQQVQQPPPQQMRAQQQVFVQPPPQQMVYQPQPQPVRQQVVYQQQPQQTIDEYDVMRAVARSTLGIAGSTMTLLGAGARVLGGGPLLTRNPGSPWVPPRPRGTPQQQRQERMKQDFVLLLTGKLHVPPGTEILTPDGFCIGRFMTSRNAIDDGLLAPGPAPLPLPPCLEPTPKDAVEIAKAQERQERERAEAAAAADNSGVGWKALSAVGRFAGKVASSAKHKVEDKVRERSANEDNAKFQSDFPQESQSEKLVIEYSCYALSGDGVSRRGRLYLTERLVLFSGAFDPPANPNPNPNAPPPQATPFRFIIGYPQIVSILKGECCSKRFLHLICGDGTFRCFTDFNSSFAGKVGSFVSSSMQGTDAYDRCFNWIDHLWRAATPIPNPTYHYAGTPGPLINQPGYRPPQVVPLGSAPTAQPPQQQYAPPPRDSGYNNNPAQEKAPDQKAAPEVPTESTTCVVCMDQQKNAFFQPCGHVCCCIKCANQVGHCPMCRAQITQVFPAFI